MVLVAESTIKFVHDDTRDILPFLHKFLKLLVCESGGFLTLFSTCEEDQNVSWTLMEVHPDGGPDYLLDPLRVFDRMKLHIHRVQFAVHLHNWALVEVIGESLRIQSGTGYNQFQSAFPVEHGLLHQGQQNIGVKRTLVGLIQDHHLVVEQIGVVDALSHKHTVSDVSDLGIFLCAVVESNSVANFFSKTAVPLLGNTIGHADGSHSPGLGANDFDLVDWIHQSLLVLLHILLALDDGLPELGTVSHVLGQLGRLSRTSVACDHQEIIARHELNDLLLVLEYGQRLSEGLEVLGVHSYKRQY